MKTQTVSAEKAARDITMFPTLSEDHIQFVSAFGVEKTYQAGDTIFARGDRHVDFHLVIEGEIEISDSSPCGTERVFVRHRPGQFAGELDQFNDQKALVNGRASRLTRVIAVKRADFRRMLVAEPDLAEIILRSLVRRRMVLIEEDRGGIDLIGDVNDSKTLQLRQFLTRNGYPHTLIPPTHLMQDGKTVCESLKIAPHELPAVWQMNEVILKNPNIKALALQLGLNQEAGDGHVYDVIIVGAGPSGLAAAVYAASEGLDTLVIESIAPGGQAGTSSRIENYLGFPNGISGQDLSGRAQLQAQKFGARFSVGREVANLDRDENGRLRIHFEDQETVLAHSIVVASGARYRKLSLPDYERYEGRGIYYAATAMESQFCLENEIIIVGGGNSAGQAAVYLSHFANQVHIFVRGKNLASSMSNYLIERIKASPKITIHYETEIVKLEGENSLERVSWRHTRTGETVTRTIHSVFVMIGADPNTSWLKNCIELDKSGFIKTGQPRSDAAALSPFETFESGVFAVGDVRADSVKRVASAVGEGSVVIQWVHRYLEGVKRPMVAQSKQG